MQLEFERIETNVAGHIQRAKVPGGWLIMCSEDVFTDSDTNCLHGNGYEWRSSICFMPDPSHTWLAPEPEKPKEIPKAELPFMFTEELFRRYYNCHPDRIDKIVYEHRVLEILMEGL